MSSSNNQSKDLEERIAGLEANLIEQEHRPVRLVWNFINRKRYWKDENDQRRLAASKAIIWRFFTSPTTIAIGTGGIIAVLTTILLWHQNDLLKVQNTLIEKQTTQLNLQTKLMESARRSSQVFIMGEVLSDIGEELNNPQNSFKTLSNPLISRIIVLSRAMKPYYYYEGEDLITSPLSSERAQLLIALGHMEIDSTSRYEINFGADFTFSDLKDSYFVDADLRGVRLKKSNLYSSYFQRSKLYNVHFDSVQMKLARMWNNDIHTSIFDRTFADSSGFRNSKLERSIFVHSSFEGADFRGADLFLARFYSSNFKDADFTNADLRYSNFEKSDLSRAKLIGCDFGYVNLDSVKVERYDWLDYIKDSLSLNGADRMYKIYRVDSVYYNEEDKTKRPMVIKRDSQNIDSEPEFYLSYNGIGYDSNTLKKNIQYNITSEKISSSIYDLELSYSTLLEYKENGVVKYLFSDKIAKISNDTIPANSSLKMKFDVMPVDEMNVLNFYVLLKGSFRSIDDGKIYNFSDLYQRNLSRLMVATKRLKGEEEQKMLSKFEELSN